MIAFVWDQAKATVNYDRHGVTFEEARSKYIGGYINEK